MSNITILPGSSDTLEKMKGQSFVPHDGEGVVYIKLVMIKPDTMQSGNPKDLVDNAPGVVLMGQLADIKAQIDEWFGQSVTEYSS